MNPRTPTIALLLITAGMLGACLIAMLRQPVAEAELAGTREVTYRIDANQADKDTLCILPRIGPGIAQRIVDDRQAKGPFQDVEDMARVSMVGEKTVAALKPWVDFE
ncbi:MAG: helix-hairpin-helix domain-containing protein [Planctomycetota bacterium]